MKSLRAPYCLVWLALCFTTPGFSQETDCNGNGIPDAEEQPEPERLKFTAASNSGAGRLPNSITGADFNRDGILDIATANASTSDVSVLLGRGDVVGTVRRASWKVFGGAVAVIVVFSFQAGIS